MSECNICKREGLPIFPVRSAVVPSHINSPAIPANFQVPVPLNVGGVHYSARPLRSGFLYVYLDFEHEMFNFIEYYITTEGYYSKVPQGQPWSSATVDGKKVCVPGPANGFADHRGKASLITVPLVDEGCAYFAWSEHRWSDELKEKYRQDETYRAQMQKLDIGACKNGGGAQANTASLSSLTQLVPEYNPQLLSIALDNMAFSCHDFVRKSPELAQVVIDSANQLAPEKGILLHFQDPTGAATDIANWMEQVYQDRFANPANPSYARKVLLLSAIDQVEDMVKQNARDTYVDTINQAKKFNGENPQYTSNAPEGMADPQTSLDKELTDERLDAQAELRWRVDYQRCFDSAQREAAKAEYQRDLAELDKTHLGPLAKAHVALMSADCMANYFHFNLPPTEAMDLDHGLRFIVTLTRMIGETAKYEACNQYYCDSLEMNTAKFKEDKYNLLYKGLILNNEQIKQALQSKSGLDGIDITQPVWTFINGIYGRLLSNKSIVSDEKWELINQYISCISRAMMKTTITSNASPIVPQALVAMAGLNGSQLYYVNKKAHRNDMIRYLVKQLMQVDGVPQNGETRNLLYRRIATRMQELEIAGINVKGSQTYRFIMLLDARKLSQLNVSSTASVDEWVNALVKLIEKSPLEDVQALKDEFYRQQRYEQAQQRGQSRRDARDFKTKISAGVNGIALIFQIAALTELLREDNEVTPDLKQKAKLRLYLSSVIVISSTMEVFGSVMSGVDVIKRQLGKLGIKVAKNVASFAGAVAGVGWILMAGFDIHSGIIEGRKGRSGLSYLYYTQGSLSGFLGLMGLLITYKAAIILEGGMLASLAAASSLLLILLIILILSMLIAILSDNALQEWLMRCLWGNYADERYLSSKQEMKAFNEALKKMRGQSEEERAKLLKEATERFDAFKAENPELFDVDYLHSLE